MNTQKHPEQKRKERKKKETKTVLGVKTLVVLCEESKPYIGQALCKHPEL